MKSYKVSLSSKLYVTIFSFLLFIAGGIFVLVRNPGLNIVDKIFIFLGFILGTAGVRAIFTVEVVTDEKQLILPNSINILPLFFGKKIERGHPFLLWSEIGEVYANYFLFAETANVILKPKEGLNKKPIGFAVGFCGMPLDLLRDILTHLPPDAKVSLYPYLKRKLEGKQTWFYVK